MRRALLTVHKFLPQHRAGTEVLTLKVAQELQRRGYQVKVVAANPPDSDARHTSGPATSDYEYEGVPVHVIEEPLRLKGYTFKHEYSHPEIGRHFGMILDEFKPDILHVFHAQNLSASVIEEASSRAIPVVCSATDFWFVCPIVQLKRPDDSICRGPEKFASNCLTCYTPNLFPAAEEFAQAVKDKFPQVDTLLRKFGKISQNLSAQVLYATYVATKLPSAVEATMKRPSALRKVANSVKAIMVPTRLMWEIFVENGIRSELLKHVPFGIDTAALLSHQNKAASEELRIGYIGTLFEHKGVDILIEAFQALAVPVRAKLTIYGDPEQFPEYFQRLLKLVESKPESSAKIKFAGTFPNSDLGQVLSSMDVLVVPSRWYENTPLVIQSAFATKTPVVATNLGGMSEIVKPEFNGLLFELNNHLDLRDKLALLADKKNGLLETLRQNIPPERTTAQMVNDIEKVYAEILGADHNAKSKSVT